MFILRMPRILDRVGRGGRPLRIGYGRVFHEANSFSPIPSERADFERFHFYQGAALAQISSLRGHELKGFLRQAELSGMVAAARLAGNVQTVPLVSAMTVPSGPLTRETFDWLRDAMVRRVREAGPLDGVYLALHGSMGVLGFEGAPEAALLDAVKTASGNVPLAVSYDLHANLSPSIVDPATILTAYRTNPHRDLFSTGRRAGTLLIRSLRGQVQPTHAWRKLPMVLGGGLTVDLMQPMRGVFARARRMEQREGALAAQVFMVHPYTGAPDLGWAVHVTTDGNQALAEQLADELAEVAWAARVVGLPALRTPREALAGVRSSTLARATGTISLVDTGDVVGTGTPGGSTHLLDAIVRHGSDLTVFVPLTDPAALAVCWGRAVGETVDLTLRGIPTLGTQPEVAVRGVVRAQRHTEFGRVVRLDSGRLSLAITDRPTYTLQPRFWREIGLDPWKADAIVQRSFFHYRFFYAWVNRKNIGVQTAGASDLENIKHRQFDQPVWPSANVCDWRPFDRIRRGLGPLEKLTVAAPVSPQPASC